MEAATNNYPSPDIVDLSQHPYCFQLWASEIISMICKLPLGCTWESNIGNLQDHLPTLLTFPEFVKNQPSSSSSFLENVYEYAFQTNSTALGDVTSPTALTTLFFLVIMFRQVKAIVLPFLQSIARQLGRRTHGVEWEKYNEEKICKFGEYVIRLLYHSAMCIYGYFYVYRNEIWWDYNNDNSHHLFYHYPNHPIEPAMAWYYLIQAAYNVEALVSLVELSFGIQFHFLNNNNNNNDNNNKIFFSSPIFSIYWKDTIRGDFREMAIHHVVTNLLVICSSYTRFFRVGSMIFFIHDLSDIPIDLSKLVYFLKWEITTFLCFVSMMGIWFYTRLYILPCVIFRSILFEAYLLMDAKDYSDWAKNYYVLIHKFFSCLVGALIILHAFWFSMFVRMLFTFLHKGEQRDISVREKKEQQEQQQSSSSQKSNGTHNHNNNHTKTE